MATQQTYMAVAVTARIVRVSNTTLFRLAADYLGDPLYWTRIASLNGIIDPWVDGIAELKIPTLPAITVPPTGIFGA